MNLGFIGPGSIRGYNPSEFPAIGCNEFSGSKVLIQCNLRRFVAHIHSHPRAATNPQPVTRTRLVLNQAWVSHGFMPQDAVKKRLVFSQTRRNSPRMQTCRLLGELPDGGGV